MLMCTACIMGTSVTKALQSKETNVQINFKDFICRQISKVIIKEPQEVKINYYCCSMC